MDGSDSHGRCSSIPKMGWAVSTGGQQHVLGPVAEQELEQQLGGQGWEMCESICHAAVLSCFSEEQTVPNAVFYVCLLFPGVLHPGRHEMGRVCAGGSGEGKTRKRGRLGRGVRR